MRRLLATLGVAAVVSGAAVAANPGLATGRSSMSLAVVFVGVLALLEGVNAVMDRLGGDRSRAELPTVERRRQLPTPGDDVDVALGRLAGPPSAERDRQLGELRRRLRRLAVDTLVAEGHTEAEARTALAAGTWTDDPHAAALFADATAVPDGPGLVDRLRGESGHRLRVRRAIDRLAERERRRRGEADG